MKNYIISAFIALCWAMPLMGVSVRNTTEKNVSVTATLPGQTVSTTVTMRPHSKEAIELKESVPSLKLSVGSLVPAHKQMTAIEPLTGSRGWLFVGRNAEGHELYSPLFPPKEKETPLQGASASYAVIDGKITRIDSFPEIINKEDTDSRLHEPASYATNIDPKSYIMVSQGKHLVTKIYPPQVVRKAAAQWYKTNK